MDEKKIFKEAFIKSLKTYEEKKRLSMTPEELEIEEYENAMFEAGESSATEISPEEQREMQEDPKYWESVVAAIDKDESISYKVYEDFIYKNGKLVNRVNKTKENQYADQEN